MDLKGTKTEENLRAALTGESLARNKYSFYAMTARKAGLDQIADALERMAKNEMMHAKFWYEKLYGVPDDARANLMKSVSDELDEANAMYPSFARQAREDGFEALAAMFESVARIEQDHARQFARLIQDLEALGKDAGETAAAPVAEKVVRTGYRCMFCGAVYPDRPDTCGVCQAIGSFELCQYDE